MDLQRRILLFLVRAEVPARKHENRIARNRHSLLEQASVEDESHVERYPLTSRDLSRWNNVAHGHIPSRHADDLPEDSTERKRGSCPSWAIVSTYMNIYITVLTSYRRHFRAEWKRIQTILTVQKRFHSLENGIRRSAAIERLRSATMFACQEIRSTPYFTTRIKSVRQEFKQVRHRIQIPRTRRWSNSC